MIHRSRRVESMQSTGSPLVVRVSDETRRKIDALAKSRGRSLNDVLNEAIDRYLAEEEWLLDGIITRIIAMRAGAWPRSHPCPDGYC